MILLIGNKVNAQTQLWGTTQAGGTGDNGLLYTISNGYTYAVAHEFTGAADGKQPTGSLCYANNGFIYGTTYNGGTTNNGVCFKINPSTLTFTKIYDFTANTGINPQYGLIKGNDGNLYGTCLNGGTTGNGVLFKIDPLTDTYSVLYHFNLTSGTGPIICQWVNNKLYGTTYYQGLHGLGTIFSYDLLTSAFVILHNNDSITGGGGGSILQVNGGKLIGTAGNLLTGPNGLGTLYSYDLTTNVRSVLFNFDTLQGIIPSIKFIEGNDGKIYGTTTYGGANNGPVPFYGDGVIYSFDLTNNTYQLLYNLDFNISGANCQGGMMQATNGLLYATAYHGGSALNGNIYSFDIISNAFTIIEDFTINMGKHPSSQLLEVPIITALAKNINGDLLKIWPNPAQDVIIIDNTDKANKVICIDILGREIDQIQLAGFCKTKVDVSAYPNVFFVKNNQGQMLKVIKGN